MATSPASATTEGIRVEVVTHYAPERSQPAAGQWFFIYTIRITNLGREPATLRRRRWEITDAEGRHEVVEGEGVVGEQPRLEPGEVFHYASGCMLRTPFGSMQGHYTMERDDDAEFRVEIPAFSLAKPYAVN